MRRHRLGRGLAPSRLGREVPDLSSELNWRTRVLTDAFVDKLSSLACGEDDRRGASLGQIRGPPPVGHRRAEAAVVARPQQGVQVDIFAPCPVSKGSRTRFRRSARSALPCRGGSGTEDSEWQLRKGFPPRRPHGGERGPQTDRPVYPRQAAGNRDSRVRLDRPRRLEDPSGSCGAGEERPPQMARYGGRLGASHGLSRQGSELQMHRPRRDPRRLGVVLSVT